MYRGIILNEYIIRFENRWKSLLKAGLNNAAGNAAPGCGRVTREGNKGSAPVIAKSAPEHLSVLFRLALRLYIALLKSLSLGLIS